MSDYVNLCLAAQIFWGLITSIQIKTWLCPNSIKTYDSFSFKVFSGIIKNMSKKKPLRGIKK